MIVLVCGGRDYQDRDAVYDALDRLHAKRGITQLIQGGATGADHLAKLWARDRSILSREFQADWDDIDVPGAVIRHRKGKPYNAAAGGLRNQKMLDEGKPDGVVAFPGEKGTKDMIARAQRAGLTVWEPCK